MKAILVIDMPKSCDECMFSDYFWNCKFCGNVDHTAFTGERYVKCPLKPMPEKKKTLDDIYAGSGFDRGYNACINEILGE